MQPDDASPPEAELSVILPKTAVGIDKSLEGPSKAWLLLGIVFLLASITIRIMTMENSLFWLDEALTLLIASGTTSYELQDVLIGNIRTAGELKEKFQTVHPGGIELVIATLQLDAPQHAPLYFVLQYYWAKAMGSTIAATRALSLIIGLLQIPAYYWLGLEATRNRLGGFICMMLAALSPFMLWYSQEARPYILIYLVFALLCASFFRAVRTDSLISWSIYAILSTLSWYTSPLTIFVTSSHLIYLLIRQIRIESGELSLHEVNKLIMPGVSIVLSLAAASFYYLPCLKNMAKATQNTLWLHRNKIPTQDLIDAWFYGPLSLFVQRVENTGFTNLLLGIVTLAILLGLFLIYKIGDRKVLTICGLMILTTAAVIHIPDLIAGGVGSTSPKYLPALVTSILILTAYGLVLQMGNKLRGFQVLGNFSLFVFMTCQLLSSYHVGMIDERSSERNQSLRSMINTVKDSNAELLITGDFLMCNVLAATHYMNPKTEILYSRSKTLEGLSFGYKRIVLFNCGPEQRANLRGRGYKLSKIEGRDYIWKASLL